MTTDVHVSTLNLVNGIAWTKTDGQLWTFWNLQSVKLLEVICEQESQFCGTFYPLSNLSNKTRQNKRWLSHVLPVCLHVPLWTSLLNLPQLPNFTNTSPSNGHARWKLRSVPVLSRTEWQVVGAPTAAMVAGYGSNCSKWFMMRFSTLQAASG